MPLGDLNRAELIDVVLRIQSAQETEEEEDRLVRLFEENVPHPAGADLIFYPDGLFGPDQAGREPTAEEIVDRGLGYKAIQL